MASWRNLLYSRNLGIFMDLLRRSLHIAHDNPSCKHRQARQTDCLTPLIIRVKSSNQSAWLACVYTIPLDCRDIAPRFELRLSPVATCQGQGFVQDTCKHSQPKKTNCLIPVQIWNHAISLSGLPVFTRISDEASKPWLRPRPQGSGALGGNA